jgi:hypothetical protein
MTCVGATLKLGGPRFSGGSSGKGRPVQGDDFRPRELVGVASAHRRDVASSGLQGKPLGLVCQVSCMPCCRQSGLAGVHAKAAHCGREQPYPPPYAGCLACSYVRRHRRPWPQGRGSLPALLQGHQARSLRQSVAASLVRGRALAMQGHLLAPSRPIMRQPRPPALQPPADELVPADQAVPWCSISCRRCVPYWEIGQAVRDRPPWDAVFGRRGVRLGCPACRSALTTTWHGGPGIPFTDGHRPQT